MLSADSLQVADEEEVVVQLEESSSSRLEDIYTLLAEGCYPETMSPIRKKNLRRYAQKFSMEDGRLYYIGMKKVEKREVVIDGERKRQIFLECHFNELSQHLGQKKTVHRIQTKYYWLGIVRDVVEWIKLCEVCQLTERNKNMVRTQRPSKVDGPWEMVMVEVIGPLPCTSHRGNTHIVIMTDYYSKWVEAVPVPRSDALSVARCITSSVYRYGAAKTLLCSQSSTFCDEVSKQLCDRWSLAPRVLHSTATDRINALLRDTIKQVVAKKQGEWDDFLDPVLSVFRTSVHPVTRFTPFCLMFNRKPETAAENPTDRIKLDLLDPGSSAVSDAAENSFLSSIQEQQTQLQQTVVSNLHAAHKEEKKTMRQRGRRLSTITLTVTEPFCPSGASPASKKLKNDLFLTIPVETVVQMTVDVEKQRLENLPAPDVP